MNINKTVSERRRKREGGNLMLESALTLVTFSALFLGIFDIGQLLFAQETITKRSRDAIRWAAVNPWSSDSIATVKNMIVYGTASPAQGQAGFYGLTTSSVSVTRPTPDYSASDNVVAVVSPIQINTFSGTLVGGLTGTGLTNTSGSGGSGSSPSSSNGTWPTLTVRVSLPYEVSNGSSH